MSDQKSLNLSVTQKALVSAGIIVGAFVAGMLLTALFIPFHWAAALWLGGLALIVLVAEIIPVSTKKLMSVSKPCATYDEALKRFADLKARDEAEIHPRCVSSILDQGRRVEKCYVLVHGISNCPYSMVDFAPRLQARGYNVLVSRMPQNGHLDNSTNALKLVTAESLREFSDASVDIAAGLGEKVVVIGISAGGVIAGWMAQNRPEIERALLLAPAYGLSSFGTNLNVGMMRLILRLPNFSVWKDPILRSRAESRPHSYKRQSTHGMGQVMRLGIATYRESAEKRAAAKAVTLVTNAADAAVDTSMMERVVAHWEAKGVPVTRYVFPKDCNLPHELLDPTEEGANPSITYPKIIELSEEPVKASAGVAA